MWPLNTQKYKILLNLAKKNKEKSLQLEFWISIFEKPLTKRYCVSLYVFFIVIASIFVVENTSA